LAIIGDANMRVLNPWSPGLSCLPALMFLQFHAAPCAASPSPAEALKSLSVEDLMNVEVTSVSRTEETLRTAAAALSIVSSEAIRRSGATSIPEALRSVPGLYVGRQNSNVWAVSARGFSSVSSEKLLVLMDTRSVYTPLFAGVLWDSQDYLLEDIDRIEVIRGPGAALWGANAVNGVINITTKSARATQGTYLEAGAGSFERAFVGVRHGATMGDDVNFRVYGRYFDRDSTDNPAAGSDDDWRVGRAGFRADWAGNDTDEFTLQGDVYRGEVGQHSPAILVTGRPEPARPLQVDVSGGNLLGRWRRQHDDGADTQLRVYYDRTRRDDPAFLDELDTVDLDFQHRFRRTRHEIIWGANYRATSDHSQGKGVFDLDPDDSNDQLFSGFIQDQVSLTDRLRLTLGTKLEHNDFSGSEVQPNVRLAWEGSKGLLWSAVSRAVRVPTRLERDTAIDVSDPALNPVVRLVGNPDFHAERLTAYEIGYRWLPATRVSLDVAAYVNRYTDLASLEFGTPFLDTSSGQTIVPIVNQNLNDGVARGIELQTEWAPLDSLRFSASYGYTDLSIDASGQDLNGGVLLEGATPKHQFGLRSSWELSPNVSLDVHLRHLTEIKSLQGFPTGEGLDEYSELDLRMAWRIAEDWELSLVGQDLLQGRHFEFGPPAARGELQRAAYVKATWRR
jgi:iron complex outermembrane receptor protein